MPELICTVQSGADDGVIGSVGNGEEISPNHYEVACANALLLASPTDYPRSGRMWARFTNVNLPPQLYY